MGRHVGMALTELGACNAAGYSFIDNTLFYTLNF